MRLEYMTSSTLPIQFGIADVPSLDPPRILRNPMKMRPISGWVRMTILFTIAGFFEVAAYGQVSAFTPLYLPHLGIEAATVSFWVGAITSFSNFAGLPFLPFWAALAFGYRDGVVRTARGGSLLRIAGDGILLIVRSPRPRALFPALFLLFAGWMLAFIYVPLVVAHLYTGPDPATAVGIVLGAGGLGIFIASPAIGAVADRYGKHQTLFAGCAVLAALWSVPFFTRELLPFTIAWTVVNGLAAALFSVSFTILSASATDTTRGRVMTFAYLPANLGFVVGPAIGSVVRSEE